MSQTANSSERGDAVSVYDITEFGAVADGVTDNTEAIRAAVHAAIREKRSDG